MRLKFKNHSPRAQWWDYSSAGTYFITICTKQKIPFFGTIEDGKMICSSIGEIVSEEWLKGPEIRPDMNITLGAFVVMPDHFHAVISIGNNSYNEYANVVEDESGNFVAYNQLQPQSKNLASVIRGFKSAVTIRSRRIDPAFRWHKLYHDVIIQEQIAYDRIERYIRNNPKNWKKI